MQILYSWREMGEKRGSGGGGGKKIDGWGREKGGERGDGAEREGGGERESLVHGKLFVIWEICRKL